MTYKQNHPQRILIFDGYCGGGGSAMGYYRQAIKSGYEPMIIGVDKTYKKDYPFIFIQDDIIDMIESYPTKWWRQFDLLNFSPPCQGYSRCKSMTISQGNKVSDELHIDIIRDFCKKIDIPYVIENVEGSGLNGALICGSHFDLKVRRHRYFESNFPIHSTTCQHKKQGKPVGVYGSIGDTVQGISSKTNKLVVGGSVASTLEEGAEAMGISWLGWSNLKEAIPPKYTEYIMRYYIAYRRIQSLHKKRDELYKMNDLIPRWEDC